MHGIELLENGICQLNLKISENQKKQFIKYYELLIEKNKVMNLTSITDLDEVMVKHFLDSLLLSSVTDMSKYESVIDVGTGAGFPGIPLKIMFPHLKLTLLDSLKKRLLFLDEVINELELDNVTTIHGRAEDYGRDKEYREKYDLCISRAVANLSSLSEYCIPFVKLSGKFISYKSEVSNKEINEAGKAIDLLGGNIVNQDIVSLPCSDIKRTFVVIEKKKNTPAKFPRKAGVPSKKPIKWGKYVTWIFRKKSRNSQ